MLVLARDKGEIINIGNNIQIVVVDVHNGHAHIGIEAPRNVPISRPDAKEGQDGRRAKTVSIR